MFEVGEHRLPIQRRAEAFEILVEDMSAQAFVLDGIQQVVGQQRLVHGTRDLGDEYLVAE